VNLKRIYSLGTHLSKKRSKLIISKLSTYAIPMTTSILFKLIFCFINLSVCYHIFLNQPSKNYVRLTCIAHYFVTIYSFLWLLSTNQPQVDTFHIYTAILMAKISFLFGGLLLLFLIYQHTEGASNPIQKRPTTLIRIIRNTYTHYGTTVILWSIPLLQGSSPKHLYSYLKYERSMSDIGTMIGYLNIGLMIWLGSVYTHFTSIYDVDHLETWKLVLPLVCLSILSDGLLLWILK